MPKSYKFEVELLPKKPNPNVLQVGNTKQVIELTSAKDLPTVFFKRMEEKAAPIAIKKYQAIIQEEVPKLEKKVLELVKKGNAKGASQMMADTAVAINGAVKGLQNAVNVEVQKQLQADAKKDKELRDAQVVVILKITLISIKFGTAVGRLAATSGADVGAWASAASSIYEAVVLVKNETATEDKLRAQLIVAIGAFDTAVEKKLPEKQIQGQIAKVESARRKHSVAVTKLRHELMNAGKKVDAFEAKLKSSKDPKAAKAVAKLDHLSKNIEFMYTNYMAIEKWTDQAEKEMKGKSIPDPKSLLQRLKAQAKDPKAVVKFSIEMVSVSADVVGLFKGD